METPVCRAFEKDLDAYLTALRTARYSARGPVRVALVSPMAQEHLARLDPYVDVKARNLAIGRYTEVDAPAWRRARRVAFVDLFGPTTKAMAEAAAPLTINGIHVNDRGDAVVGALLMAGLGFSTRHCRASGVGRLRSAARSSCATRTSSSSTGGVP